MKKKKFKKVRIGIIGCGNIAMSHAKGYSANKGVDLVAFCDVDGEKAKRFADEFNGRSYSDHRVMIEKEDLEGVSVCTIPSTHKKIVMDAVNKGINVLCEKPLATTVSEAKTMVMAAKQNKVLLITGFKFRFAEGVMQARRIIQEGKIGKVITFRNMFGGFIDMSKSWFSKRDISGGGVLLDNGVHAIDLFRFLLGEIKSVSAQINTFVQDIEVEDSAVLLLEMQDGAIGTIDLSWSIPAPSENYVEIYGSDGTILISWNGMCYYTKGLQRWVTVKKAFSHPQLFRKQTAHFIKCITRKEKPIVDGMDGLRTLEAIEAAYKSDRKKTWIKI